MKVKIIILVATMFGSITHGMKKISGLDLTVHQVKKIVRRWEGKVQFIPRLQETAATGRDDCMAFRSGLDLIAIFNSKEHKVTTCFENKTSIETSYAIFEEIINNREAYETMPNYRGTNLCLLQ